MGRSTGLLPPMIELQSKSISGLTSFSWSNQLPLQGPSPMLWYWASLLNICLIHYVSSFSSKLQEVLSRCLVAYLSAMRVGNSFRHTDFALCVSGWAVILARQFCFLFRCFHMVWHTAPPQCITGRLVKSTGCFAWISFTISCSINGPPPPYLLPANQKQLTSRSLSSLQATASSKSKAGPVLGVKIALIRCRMADSAFSLDDLRYLASTSGCAKCTDLSLVGLRACFWCFLTPNDDSEGLHSVCFFLENIVQINKARVGCHWRVVVELQYMRGLKQPVTRPVKSQSAKTFFKPATTSRTQRLHTVASQSTRKVKQGGDTTSFLTVEGLQQENQGLKQRINSLKKTISQQKSREVHDQQTLLTIRKQFDVFDKEKYFGRRGHNLVEGVKHQYRLIKQKYDNKCSELNKFLAAPTATEKEEVKVYHDMLQADSKKLHQQMAAVLDLEEAMMSNVEGKVRLEEVLAVSAKIAALEKREEDLGEKCNRLEVKIDSLRAKLELKERKIEMLDKLLTEKNNELHHTTQKEKRVTKEYKFKVQQVKELKKQVQQQEEDFTEMLHNIKERQSHKYETEKSIFESILLEKDEELSKVKQQLEYLSTIVSFLQAGDDRKPQMQIESVDFDDLHHQDRSEIEKTMMSLKENTRKRVRSIYDSPKMQRSSPALRTQHLKVNRVLECDYDGASDLNNEGMGDLRMTALKSEKEGPNLSSQKHSWNCQKVRLVRPQQIAPYREQLTARLTFYMWQFQKIGECMKGEGQYITMGELWNILKDYPFQLENSAAEMLARYIVEDNTSDEVYYHINNQIQRNIASSILRAFITPYALPDVAAARQEIDDTLINAGKNLQSALTSLVPSGVITAAKFIEICGAIQVTFSPNAQSFILGQLLARSDSWDKLQFRHLFEDL